ncbi:NUDIX hydrolase domain-containingprotein [Purpureocillium lilacinum]|uniref:NUDIX hydrolase domain-containingprotein n=1 Tax=Purpureocillium lilacinum TaxID=33203 RepID=A0A179HQ10_PURLI|nr:NUDIX hydrolase domain-containingprotein [Purpureocillium lilacinum]OAQ92525.1 NUDIX hydrolase domain-containingprotein [Purpureocillium lilacinum]GJN84299.1 hypothetical protein PLIIFM63780_007855 [Purpureocillium lilacinum]
MAYGIVTDEDTGENRHKYAPISGSVEASDASPLATAWRELGEETTLTARQLRLFRQGKPYTFSDTSVGREWTINPFAFIFTTPDSSSSSTTTASPSSLPPSSSSRGGETKVDDSPKDRGYGGDADEEKDKEKQDDRRAGLRLDWEHEGYAWFDPADVSDDPSFGGVPRLKESLRRVWFEIDLGRDAARVLDEGLRALQADHESGARQLAAKALDVFMDVLPLLPRSADSSGIDERWWRNVRIAGWHLWKNGREAMGAPILSVVLACLGIIEEKVAALPSPRTPSSSLSRAFIDDVLVALRAFAAYRTETGRAIGEAFAQFLRDEFSDCATPGSGGVGTGTGAGGDADGGVGQGGGAGNLTNKDVKIVTLSCSSTITAALTHALKQPDVPALDIHVLESRPLFEGVKTARALAAALHTAGRGSSGDGAGDGEKPRGRVTLHTDSSAAVAAHGAHMVLLGADLISPRGDVSNKTGSLPLVLSARHVNASGPLSSTSSHPVPQKSQHQHPVRIVALAEKEKVLPFEPPAHAEENDPREVSVAWDETYNNSSEVHGDGKGKEGGEGNNKELAGGGGGEVEVKNVYFEWVPAALVTDYVTEDGATTRGGIEEWAKGARERADRFFGDL